MSYQPKKLRRLSLCECGFKLLHDHIPLGTIYQVDMATIRPGGKLICGGCKAEIPVTVVNVKAGPTNPTYAGILPLKIFTKPSKPVEANEETEFWRAYRSEQQDRRAARLPGRQAEIESLAELGHKVRKLTEYQFRINNQVDVYPIHNRYHVLISNKRGTYRNLPAFLASAVQPVEILNPERKKSMLDIAMEEVDSSNIHSVGYDENTKTLRIRFHSSMDLNWDYTSVPEARYVGLRDADSVGKYFNAHIKGVFPYTKGAA